MQGAKTAAKEIAREMAAYPGGGRRALHLRAIWKSLSAKKAIAWKWHTTWREPKRKLESQIFDIIISDVRMPGEGGVDLLKFTKEIAPDCFFLLITGVPTVETAIAAINSGADRYVIKDHELVDQLRRAVHEVSESLRWKKEAGYLRRELRRLTGLDNIIGQSPKMRAIFELIQTVAPQTSRVLDHRRERHR